MYPFLPLFKQYPHIYRNVPQKASFIKIKLKMKGFKGGTALGFLNEKV
jgi:hypothetical protein